MRSLLAPFALTALIGVAAMAQGVRLPQVFERTLGNGLRVLVVERPGTGAIHAQLFIRGGRANTGGLPPVAADLLARTLFRRVLPAGLETRLEPILEREGRAFEALRLDQLAQARLPAGAQTSASPEQHSLKALEETAMAALRQQVGATETWDGLDALGGSGRTLGVSADFLSHGVDLPSSALAAWCGLEVTRLRRLPVGRFPLERERLAEEIDAGEPPLPPALSVLLATALSGRPYALVAEFHRSQVESITWRELQTYARGALSRRSSAWCWWAM